MNETPTISTTTQTAPTAVSGQTAVNGAANGSARVETSPTTSPVAVPPSALRNAPIATSSTRNVVPSASLPSVEDMKREEQVAAIAMKARLDLRRGQRDKARAEIAQALALNPNDVTALELMGDVFLEEGEQEKAILVFEKGRALHPNHAPFAEKIRLAKRDLDEMAVDQLTQKFAPPANLLTEEIDVKPGRAAILSLLIPGGGQFYLEQNERGAIYLGLAFLSLCGWALPLRSAMSQAGAAVKASGSILAGWSSAISSMSGGAQLLFWVMSTLFSVLYLVSAWDAYTTVARRQATQRQTNKLNTEHGIRNTESKPNANNTA